MESPKIIHIPYNSNPYQTLLLDNLKAFGLSVEVGRIVRFPHLGDISVLSNIINNSKVNILHLHWQHQFLLGSNKVRTILRSLSFILQLIFVKVLGTKMVWTVHNIRNHEGKHEKLEIFFSSILARLADVIIAHCESAKQQIREKYHIRNEHKIVVIPHGSFLNVYDNRISREDARNRLNLSPTDLTFLFLGNMRAYKGILDLIYAFREINCEHATLILAGRLDDKSLIKVLGRLVKGEPTIKLIPGFISDDDIQIYMNAADILVLPYTDILTSGAGVLGISFGKTIIAPKIGCLKDILDEAGSFLYDPDENNGLMDAMRLSIASKSSIPQMGNHNLNLAKKFQWQDIAKSTYRVYKACLESS